MRYSRRCEEEAMTEPLALDIGSTVQNTVDMSVRVGIRLLFFLAILTAGWFVARLLRKAVRRGLRRFRAGEPVASLLWYAVLLVAVHIGYAAFGPNPVREPIVVIVVVAAAIARAAYDLVSAALGRLPYGPLLSRGTQVTITGLGVIAALNQVGVATTVT